MGARALWLTEIRTGAESNAKMRCYMGLVLYDYMCGLYFGFGFPLIFGKALEILRCRFVECSATRCRTCDCNPELYV
jgi:hypothetical protein